MSRPFANNLRAGDRVMEASTKLVGDVVRDPGTKHRKTYVRFTGHVNARGVDVMDLRFIPPGDDKPEDVAPIDGEAPPAARDEIGPSSSLLETAKREKSELEAEIKAMTDRAHEVRVRIERIDAAIKVLEGRA